MATYKEINETGTVLWTASGVLDPVALSGVSTTSGSNLLTVASTTGVFPGMAIKCSTIPLGSFVHAVKNSTTLELYCTARDGTTGAITTTATAANATATASSMTAHALGFDPNCIIAGVYVNGTWRNIIRGYEVAKDSPSAVAYGTQPFSSAPTYSGAPPALASLALFKSDELSSNPLKRDNSEWYSYHILVCTNGHQIKVPAVGSKTRIVYAGA